jgi:hypothetical protein
MEGPNDTSFLSQPPFSESVDKKSEFPDAFAAAALQAELVKPPVSETPTGEV